MQGKEKMANEKDKNLVLIESELNLLRRHMKNILTEDFDAVDEAEMSISSALLALDEYRLSLQPARGEILGDEALAA